MLAKMMVQTSQVRSYFKKDKAGNPTTEKVASLELVGMEMPDPVGANVFAGALRVNLPAPEGAPDGPFMPLVCSVLNVEIVGLRVRMMGTEQMIEFKGRLPVNGNGAPLPPLPTTATAPAGNGKAASRTVEVKA